MSEYTSQLRYICETLAGLSESTGYTNVSQVIAGARPKIFSFQYPIFQESYRETLETKIIKHYYTREIALESFGLWQLKLDTKMNEIMPYYNQLYASTLLEFDPFHDVDVTRQHTTENESTANTSTSGSTTTSATSETTTEGTNSSRYSDTPQGTISNLQANTYLSNATITDDDVTVNSQDSSNSGTSSTANTAANNTENFLETVTGKQGLQSYSSMLLEYRETMLNIDMMVIDELAELFFNLY